MMGSHAAHGRSVLLAAAAVAAGTSLLLGAFGAEPPEVNLFSGEPAVKPETERAAANPVLNFLVRNLGSRENPAAVTPPAASMSHTLVFQDGRQLRGELVSLGKQDLVWKRSDANAQLTFARSEIRFIALSR